MAIFLTRAHVEAGLEALKRIKQGLEPSPADLENAPLLDLWTVHDAGRGVVYLAGSVSGHPTLDDGHCTTSPLLYMPTDRTWARTVSRYYRLGKSLSQAFAQSRATH
ncbi:DUF6634 family protein [Pelagibacterium halotolerans]|uniref:Uncharacterized protein n=1 Tax=Pelagibacterium halotolerans (strain DSM 22347 / JCM 15775 / CGMCC 1.7692 / B2) TaxID=1082931 RepID=G4RC82_PELHB|nr:DUF6634 family protein [Pelagibacterium halotolerans]AEQ52705.1 hypothetical protein KKY_2697 [Pelagibacterium halotolerans B2]QJR17592.1 hypothetical protein HKM20_03545 [Pelagibacterium halotolerans]SEA84767.1 hypothetical protein SAMN05428936_109100 [Pelagibacterium halotolerans]